MKDKKYLDYELDELLEYELISFIKDLIIGIRSADCTRQKVLLTI